MVSLKCLKVDYSFTFFFVSHYEWSPLHVQVDGKDLRNATHDQAVETIRNASNPVKFVVQSLTDPACVSIHIKGGNLYIKFSHI